MKNIKKNKAKQIKFSILDKLTPEQVAIYFRESQNNIFDKYRLDSYDEDGAKKEYNSLIAEVNYVKEKSNYYQSNVFFGLMQSYSDECIKLNDSWSELTSDIIAEYEEKKKELVIANGKHIIESHLLNLQHALFNIKQLLDFYYQNYSTYATVESKFYDSRFKTESFEELYTIHHKQNQRFFDYLDMDLKYQFKQIQERDRILSKMMGYDGIDGRIYNHKEYLEIKERYDVYSSDIARLKEDGFVFAKEFDYEFEKEWYTDELKRIKKDKELYELLKPDSIEVHMKKFDEKPKATYDMKKFKIIIPDSEKFFEDDDDVEYLKLKDMECFTEEEYAKLEKGEKLEYDDDGNLIN